MATSENISIEKGRTGEITITVVGIDDWTELKAKFCAVQKYGDDPAITLVGVISDSSDEVTFAYLNSTTANLAVGRYYYEVIIYSDSLSFVKNTNMGILSLEPTIKTNPTL